MKKSLVSALLLGSLFTGALYSFVPQTAFVLAEESSEMEGHDHEGEEDHDHDHEGEEEHHHHHDHDHEFEFDASKVVKKEDDMYIMAHGDHFHKIKAADLTEEQVAAADKNIEEHPELAEAYDKQKDIYAGYFDDADVKDRSLEEYAGEWQSVLPFLEDGTLDPVMDKKASAEGAKMTAEEYKEYYQVGYETDVDHINIEGDQITFVKGDEEATGTYKYEGYKILDYEKGNRGVRYLFTKTDGDEAAPMSVQFSDHNIAPSDHVEHFHIFFSNDDHEKLLEEMDNWPTYYPADWDGDEIFADQMNH
ncbi:ZinT/AdcA family metal-binding protein [Eremococcus coleocola]|uniref:ZinT/AdcA family metal-binding protein n=1 Tax=Eremococcus coleocola TaxID=88132 RepID=UPI000404BE57|nr:ZinT/AdcA family metal-binding protein [Eremococcus coleocola]